MSRTGCGHAPCDSPRRNDDAEETASSAPGPDPPPQLGAALAADAATPLAILGGLALWLLRLALAPASTLAGFRAWVLAGVPGRPRPPRPGPRPAAATAPRGRRPRPPGSWHLVTERHGPLASHPAATTSPRSAPPSAPAVDLNPGSARAALRKAVLAARNGDPR